MFLSVEHLDCLEPLHYSLDLFFGIILQSHNAILLCLTSVNSQDLPVSLALVNEAETTQDLCSEYVPCCLLLFAEVYYVEGVVVAVEAQFVFCYVLLPGLRDEAVVEQRERGVVPQLELLCEQVLPRVLHYRVPWQLLDDLELVAQLLGDLYPTCQPVSLDCDLWVVPKGQFLPLLSFEVEHVHRGQWKSIAPVAFLGNPVESSPAGQPKHLNFKYTNTLSRQSLEFVVSSCFSCESSGPGSAGGAILEVLSDVYNKQMSKEGKEEIRVKLLIIGESSVGKSSLLTQYVDEEFKANHEITIGVQYKQKTLGLEDGSGVRVQIWDTAGTSRYNTITPNYYRNIDGILLVFDISSQKSFQMVNFWIKEVNEKTDISRIDMLLVGNKIDLEESREVKKETAGKIADDIGIKYVQTSAKTFDDTRVAFDQLVAKILKRKKKLDSTAEGFKLQPKEVKKKKDDNCC